MYNAFLTSWTFAYESMFFYQGHNPIHVLKINPIVVFVANYLCLVLLDYLDGFLYSKGITGWSLENLF